MKVDLTLDDLEHQRFYIAYHKIQKELERMTGHRDIDIKNLLITYHKFVLALGKGNKQMSRSQFGTYFQAFYNVHNLNLVDSMLTFVDPTSKKSISPIAFVQLLSAWLTPSLDDKIKFCFNVYDNQGLGYLTREKLRGYCRNMLYADQQEDAEELVSEYVEFLVRKMDRDHDGKISFNDYEQSVKDNHGLLQFLGNIIPDLAVPLAVFTYE